MTRKCFENEDCLGKREIACTVQEEIFQLYIDCVVALMNDPGQQCIL